MPATERMSPPSWEELSAAEQMSEADSWSAGARYGHAIQSLRHIVWCSATKLNDNHRLHIHEQHLLLGVRR